MTILQHAPIWLLFAALAIPLACVGWTSRRLAREIAATADYTPKTTSEGPVTYNDDGTISQTISFKMLQSIKGQVTIPFGPISVTANAREWAANSLLPGLVMVVVGLFGLIHFPTNTTAAPRNQRPNETVGPSPADVGEQRDGQEPPTGRLYNR